MMKHLKSLIVLTAICSIVAVLMAATNTLTAPIIKKNESAAENAALLEVMPNGTGFSVMDIAEYTLPATVTEIYSEESGGYVMKLETAGYSSGMVIMCGIDNTGKITGAVCLGSGETLGYEKTYGIGAVGLDTATIDTLDTIAGATKTTGGYKNALKDALNAYTILGGGEVDLRSEEEILADNLKAALPEGEGFEDILITEVLDSVDTIYKASNDAGYVYVIGETFVGVNPDGHIHGHVDDPTAMLVSHAFNIMHSSVITEIDTSAYDLSKNILKVGKTSNGNYVFELRAAGYGINGDEYSRTNEYIYLTLAATPEGEIIAVKTTAQHETKGFGSACADKSFYGQFAGKNADTYSDIIIAGATKTTDGYHAAIAKALEAIVIMEGAN